MRSQMVARLVSWTRWSWIILIAGVLLTPLNPPRVQGGEVVARVNGSKITHGQLMRVVHAKLPMVSYHGRVSAEKRAKIEGAALKEIIERELLAQEAERRGLRVPESEVVARLRKMRGRFGGATPAQLRQDIQKELLAGQLLRVDVDARVRVTDEEMRNYFRANRNKFVRPESVHLTHILVRVDPGGGERAWEQGRERALRLFARLKAGADFAALARRYSQDPSSRQRGGELGWVHRGQLIPDLERVAFSLRPGEVGGPIQTIYGFHILRVEDKQPRRQLEYAEIDQTMLQKRLLRKARERRRAELIAGLRARARIEVLGTLKPSGLQQRGP